MNFTEKMFDRWPVTIDVVRLNCSVSEPGLYAWMLIRWSSEPEARRRPDRDQLLAVSQRFTNLQENTHVPQSVHTAIMPLELIHNVQIVDPMLITIDAANVRIRSALVTNFPLQ